MTLRLYGIPDNYMSIEWPHPDTQRSPSDRGVFGKVTESGIDVITAGRLGPDGRPDPAESALSEATRRLLTDIRTWWDWYLAASYVDAEGSWPRRRQML